MKIGKKDIAREETEFMYVRTYVLSRSSESRVLVPIRGISLMIIGMYLGVQVS